jgi:hypothetical protein
MELRSAERGAKSAQSPLALEVANTILFASLATNSNAAKNGLTESELAAILSQPNRLDSHIAASIRYIDASSTYLHHDSNKRMFYQQNKNIVAKVNHARQYMPSVDVERDIERRLREVFSEKKKTKHGSPYDELLIFPDSAQIKNKCAWNHSILAIIRPDEWDKTSPYTSIQQLTPMATKFFQVGLPGCSNKLLMLSLDREVYKRIMDNIGESLAYEQVINSEIARGVSTFDPELSKAISHLNGLKASTLQNFLNLPSHLILPYGNAPKFQPVKNSGGFFGNAIAGTPCGHSMIWETLVSASKIPKCANSDSPSEWINDSSLFQTEVGRFNSKVFTSPKIPKTQIDRLAADCTHWIWCLASTFDQFVAKAVQHGDWKLHALHELYEKKPKDGWPPEPPQAKIGNHLTTASQANLGQMEVEVKAINADGYESTTASNPGVWNKHQLSSSPTFLLDDIWAKIRPTESKTGQTGEEIEIINRHIRVDGAAIQQGGDFNVSLDIYPPCAQKMCVLLYTTDGSAPANHGVRHPGDLGIERKAAKAASKKKEPKAKSPKKAATLMDGQLEQASPSLQSHLSQPMETIDSLLIGHRDEDGNGVL